MLKIVYYKNCCGMDVHKFFVIASIATTNDQGITTYKSKRFPPSLGTCASVQHGGLRIVVGTSAWSSQGNIGLHLQHSGADLQYRSGSSQDPKYVKAIRG
mgnify:CR=1 FL=1